MFYGVFQILHIIILILKVDLKNKASSYTKLYGEIKEPENVSYPIKIDIIPEFKNLNNLKIITFLN